MAKYRIQPFGKLTDEYQGYALQVRCCFIWRTLTEHHSLKNVEEELKRALDGKFESVSQLEEKNERERCAKIADSQTVLTEKALEYYQGADASHIDSLWEHENIAKKIADMIRVR